MTHLKPRSTTVLLYQGDDMDTLAHLKRKLDLAKSQAQRRETSGAARMDDAGDGEDTTVAEAQREYDAAVDAAADRALEVEIQDIGRRRFRDLIEAHPPRMVNSEPDAEGKTVQVMHDEDAGWGINTATFPEALLTFRDDDRMTIAQPAFKNKAEVQAFVDDELSAGDFDDLWAAAFMINRSPSADPFQHRSTTASASSGATSR